jgi:hypothetical protein
MQSQIMRYSLCPTMLIVLALHSSVQVHRGSMHLIHTGVQVHDRMNAPD